MLQAELEAAPGPRHGTLRLLHHLRRRRPAGRLAERHAPAARRGSLQHRRGERAGPVPRDRRALSASARRSGGHASASARSRRDRRSDRCRRHRPQYASVRHPLFGHAAWARRCRRGGGVQQPLPYSPLPPAASAEWRPAGWVRFVAGCGPCRADPVHLVLGSRVHRLACGRHRYGRPQALACRPVQGLIGSRRDRPNGPVAGMQGAVEGAPRFPREQG